MKVYFCPFCKAEYEFETKSRKLSCRVCGEDLIRKSSFDIKRGTAYLLLLSFTFPLIFYIVYFIDDLNERKNSNSHEELISLVKDD